MTNGAYPLNRKQLIEYVQRKADMAKIKVPACDTSRVCSILLDALEDTLEEVRVELKSAQLDLEYLCRITRRKRQKRT